ncbi:S41 family peptidase [Psychroflexus aestuariivivens]|uniref:S41 family peptidase n=1 Tax=Psychroflexus aestuariivivens TaxID=1795040 RepID=UPI000FDC4317|nr:S41 family peptidase [Psychroflexus aestuariivivens]
MRLFCFIFSFFTFQLYAQDEKFCEQVFQLKDLVQTMHYDPKPVNDSLSEEVFKLLVDNIDQEDYLLYKSDIELFSVDRYKIDDYVLNGNCDFIDKYVDVISNRINQTSKIISNLKNEKLDYSGWDTLFFDSKKKSAYFRSDDNHVDYWNRMIRYKVILEIIDQTETKSEFLKKFDSLQALVQPRIVENELCKLNELKFQKGDLKKSIQETFLDAYVKYQDPNSSFFNPSEKNMFESSVSNSQLSFGIWTDKNDDGEIFITHISPGSVAFANGKLDENDVLRSLRSGEDKLTAFCVSNFDVISFLNNEAYNTVVFEVKKKNGDIKKVELTKSELKVENNTLESYIIEASPKIAYISIPSFYTDLDSPTGFGTANDFAKELFKINKAEVDGLIIDLRFNGGGSMKEASELSGIFIDKGPLTILKHRNNDNITIKDQYRGTIFEEPVVVLVNDYSASASELFAGVLQDYNRAIIVGSPTFGKATSQYIFELSEQENLGYCKLTVEKFYRVNGKSHQKIGVLPDVILPSIYNNFESQEKHQAFALSNDQTSVDIEYETYPDIDFEDIQSKSASRVKNNADFQLIKKQNIGLVNYLFHKKVSYSFTPENVYEDVSNYKKIWDFEYDTEPFFSLKNTASTEEALLFDPERAKLNVSIREELSKDIYIFEAFNIINDYINQNQKQ